MNHPALSPKPKTVRATLVRPADPIQAVMRRMDWAALEIILVVDDDDALVGTITDGDIRRGILRGTTLERPASEIMNTNPIAMHESTSPEEALEVMQRFGIRHLPILDAHQRPVRLELLNDLVDDMSQPSAVIMAGGLGQRLRPLTEDTPKPLLKVADRPILDHILSGLHKSGIHDVAITLNYLGDRIRRHVGNGEAYDVNVNYVTETKRLGTAGALALLQPRPKQPFLVMNGDLLTDVNFANLLRYQQTTRHDLVACVLRHETTIPYGVLDIKDDCVTGITEKPVIRHFINAGIYVLAPHCLDYIPPDRYYDMPDLIRAVLDSGGSVGAFPIIEYWRDIGNPGDYATANREKMNAEAALKGGGTGIPAEVLP